MPAAAAVPGPADPDPPSEQLFLAKERSCVRGADPDLPRHAAPAHAGPSRQRRGFSAAVPDIPAGPDRAADKLQPDVCDPAVRDKVCRLPAAQPVFEQFAEDTAAVQGAPERHAALGSPVLRGGLPHAQLEARRARLEKISCCEERRYHFGLEASKGAVLSDKLSNKRLTVYLQRELRIQAS